MTESTLGYSQFDCESQSLPQGDVLQEVYVDGMKNPPNKTTWNWCHFVTAVYGCFCCQPFGIVSFVMAMLAYTDHKAKDFPGSRRKHKVALGFGIASIVIGSLFIIFYIIMFIYNSYVVHLHEDNGEF